MTKKSITQKLTILLVTVGIIACCLFTVLTQYNRKISANATAELGALYMSEMMFQMQDHFQSIITTKSRETAHIAEHTQYNMLADYRTALRDAASNMNFDYLALYGADGSYETLLGETAWYRNLDEFVSKVLAGQVSATTGYLTTTDGKYIVFGFPAQYEMENGLESIILLTGFYVEKLYDYIHIDSNEQLSENINLRIILTNGSYVLNKNLQSETSFFNYISNFGSFVGMSTEEGIAQIETAMASRNNFTHMVYVDNNSKHIYGSPAGEPDDWYFVLSMSQSTPDRIIEVQNTTLSHSFLMAGLIVLLLLLSIFLFYLKLTSLQIKETECARQEAEQARIEAETANQAKSVFLSNMSHDIRTPMNAIIGFATIAEDSITADNKEKALVALTKMKRSSDYLRSLICDVLDMSKIESGMITLSTETMSLKHSVDTVSTIAHTQAAIKKLNFSLKVHDLLHDNVACDFTRLNQILINLLSNAIKFTPEDGNVTLEVWQEPSDRGGDYIHTHFVVQDTGIGMSKEFTKIMFESFAREDSKVRKIEGTGLGLTITKSLLDMMGGTISVESTEGKGSTFHVALTLPKSSAEAVPEISPIEFTGPTQFKILLTEDNEFNYDIAQSLLESHGFITELAENGQIAVEKYSKNPHAYHLILMDLRMPVLDGYQAAEQIRAFEAGFPTSIHIPIFAVSADVFAEDIERCYAVGMEAHIAKPINIDELLRTMQRYL